MVSFGNDSRTGPGGENRIPTPSRGFQEICHWTIATGAAAMTFEEAIDYALTLPGTERSVSYGRPCVKRMVAASFLSGTSHRKPLRCIWR